MNGKTNIVKMFLAFDLYQTYILSLSYDLRCAWVTSVITQFLESYTTTLHL